MAIQVDVPQLGRVEFPEGTSKDTMSAAIKTALANQQSTNDYAKLDIGMPQKDALNTLKAGLLGFGSGSRDALVGLGQVGSKGLEALGIVPQGTTQEMTNDYNATRQARLQSANDMYPGHQTAVSTGNLVGEIAPLMAVPGGPFVRAGRAVADLIPGLSKGLATGLGNVAGNYGMGRTVGAAVYSPENDNMSNSQVGGLLGAGLPIAGKVVSTVGGKMLLPMIKNIAAHLGVGETGAVSNQLLKGVDQNALPTLEAGKRLGLSYMTPAEASGSTFAAAKQGQLGITEKGSLALQDASQKRFVTEQQAISGLLNDISPDSGIASPAVRLASKQIIGNAKQARADLASPLYDSAFKTQVPPETLASLSSDPVIGDALKSVTGDPELQNSLNKYGPNSLNTLQLVKENIDSRIAQLTRDGESKTGKRVAGLMETKDLLVKQMDDLSSDFKAARQIYSAESPGINDLTEGTVGQIANLPDDKLKNLGRIIFDPSQTDPSNLMKLQRQITAQDPNAWRTMVRNYMEDKLESAKQDFGGSNFYRQFLASDKDYNNLQIATRDLPAVQAKLADMRLAFKNLIDQPSVKGSAALSKGSISSAREPFRAIRTFLENMTGGQYDKAGIDFITSNKWDQQLKQIQRMKDLAQKRQAYMNLFNGFNTTSNVVPDNPPPLTNTAKAAAILATQPGMPNGS